MQARRRCQRASFQGRQARFCQRLLTFFSLQWELGAQPKYRLRWVGGNDFYLEIPWTDITGNDIGISRDAALMDEDARIIVCEKTPNCKAINIQGWMKKSLEVSLLSRPEKSKHLFVRVPKGASAQQLAEIREFFLACYSRLPPIGKFVGEATAPASGRVQPIAPPNVLGKAP
jgi:hypothetical protein